MFDWAPTVDTVWLQPKVLVKNRKLAILYWILMSVCALMAFANVFGNARYFRTHLPQAYGLEAWTNKEKYGTDDFADLRHCEGYNYVYDETWQYRPSACIAVTDAERSQMDGSTLLIPTHLQDRYVEEVSLSDIDGSCDAHCQGQETPSISKIRLGGRCMCSRSEESFATWPEEEKYFLNHGFVAEYKGAMGLGDPSVLSGTSRQENVMRKSMYPAQTVPLEGAQLITVIKDRDGNECKVGGKSTWHAADAVSGIGGTLRDWLRCGGYPDGLDSPATELRSNHVLEDKAPTLRLTGVNLVIRLGYHWKSSSLLDGDWTVICAITVLVTPVWNIRNQIDYTSLSHSSGSSTYRERKMYVTDVGMQVAGQFQMFDLPSAITALAGGVVLLSLPAIIVAAIAAYCTGRYSKIYNQALHKEFDIENEVHAVCTRIIIAQKVWENWIVESQSKAPTTGTCSRRLRSPNLSPNGDEEAPAIEAKTEVLLADLDLQSLDKEANPSSGQDAVKTADPPSIQPLCLSRDTTCKQVVSHDTYEKYVYEALKINDPELEARIPKRILKQIAAVVMAGMEKDDDHTINYTEFLKQVTSHELLRIDDFYALFKDMEHTSTWNWMLEWLFGPTTFKQKVGKSGEVQDGHDSQDLHEGQSTSRKRVTPAEPGE